MLRTAVETVGGRVPVLTRRRRIHDRARVPSSRARPRSSGVDGLMVLPAMVYKSDPRETIAHFRTVARASALPIMVYNNPVSYGVDITPEMFAELADEPTLVAIKESSENVRRITDLYNLVGDRYMLFAGVDDLVLESVLLGVQRLGFGPGQRVPGGERRALGSGDGRPAWEAARQIYRWYTPLLHLDTKPKLVQYIKLRGQETGRGSEMVRAPRLPLEGAEREQILALMRKAIATRPTLRQPA